MGTTKLNFTIQEYKGISIKLIDRSYPGVSKAKRYVIMPAKMNARDNQNVWIPNRHLEDNGTLKPGENIDYVFRKAQNQLIYAGYDEPIIGIKRRTKGDEPCQKKKS